jgi:hypothetical protein
MQLQRLINGLQHVCDRTYFLVLNMHFAVVNRQSLDAV